MTFDPARVIADEAIKAANGNAAPQAPPLELVLQNSRVDVIDAADQQTGAKLKVVIVTHATGGLRVAIPLPLTAAREVGNALCDRPNISLP